MYRPDLTSSAGKPLLKPKQHPNRAAILRRMPTPTRAPLDRRPTLPVEEPTASPPLPHSWFSVAHVITPPHPSAIGAPGISSGTIIVNRRFENEANAWSVGALPSENVTLENGCVLWMGDPNTPFVGGLEEGEGLEGGYDEETFEETYQGGGMGSEGEGYGLMSEVEELFGYEYGGESAF